jgi:GH25 family lysozyme M1 (1,4-beta-N-acetylmuramidase)
VGFSTFARPVRLALLAAAVLLLGTLAQSAPAATTRAKGVDVSNWQHTINWTKVAGAGYRFAFAKATEGTTYSDPTYPANRSGSEGAGLVFGAYHFARPAGTSQAAATASAVAQADYFVNVAAPEPGELPPVLDLEAAGSLSPTLLTQWTQTWLDEVYARTGIRSFVYSSPSFWNDRLADTTDIAASGYGLWIAHWTSASAPWVPASNWDGAGWSFWQWTNKSTVPGISGRTDADRMNGGNPSSLVIAGYPSSVPASLTAPSLVGVAEAGYLMAAVPGTWNGGKPVLFSYQWRRCDAAGANCVAIPGATSESYRANAADVGHSLKVAVNATASSGAATASSAPSVAVSPAGTPPTARPAAITLPAVAGTAQVGQTLTSSVGTWSGSPTKFTYRWQRCNASGAACATIAKATASHYTLTPDDLGSTLVVVVTATGTGGATSAPTLPTSAVVPAPLPPVSIGTQTAEAGIAGNVQTADGRAVVTWQPGSVPVGLAVRFTGVDKAPANAGTGLALSAPGLPAKGFRWPLDVEYTQPLAGETVVGWSANGKVFEPVPAVAGPKLPAKDVAGTYLDSTGLTHVLVRTPLHLAAFPKGGWGDPRFTTPKGPTLARLGSLRLVPQRGHTVSLATRLSARSQVRLQAWLSGPHGKVRILGRGSRLGPPLAYPGSYAVAKTERDKPGSFPVRLRLNARALRANGRYVLHLWATDPWGRHRALSLRFTYP